MKKILLSTLLALGLVNTATAQDQFPNETLTIIVPYAPGGSSDSLARALAQTIGDKYDFPVIVDNRPGGSTIIGSQRLLNQKPDGHTVLITAASFVINPLLMPSMPFDIETDFQPVSLLAVNPHLLVINSEVPADDLESFINWTRDADGTYSSFGNGSSGHLGFELLKEATNVDLLHIPYKGSAPATLAVLTGEVDATLGDVGVVSPHLSEGKIKPIAITGDERLPMLPDVPTFKEIGYPEYSSQTWLGLLTHSEVPTERVERLNEIFNQALNSEEVQKILTLQGMSIQPMSPTEFTDYMKQEKDKYQNIIESAQISLE